ncbi:MAG: 50S ribosomal protein L6 [Elusimicrobia bacterium RIFOXYB2_FULL_48_7]|nr:MAG: 50S ribosomal protein L6 [Elusimicrobia bacterium RIFOXYB2_FULL_48_7]
MSRLAKKPIIIPEKTKFEIKDHYFIVTGPLGILKEKYVDNIEVKTEDGKVFVNRSSDKRLDRMSQGLVWSLIRNAIAGVTKGFNKSLEIRGIGYNGQVIGQELVLRIGFSHLVKFKIPEGIKITVDSKGIIISVSGFDKQLVGETSAKIRRIKPPEPYKGTGIRYVGEYVAKKAGKTAVGVGAGAGAGGGGGAKK